MKSMTVCLALTLCALVGCHSPAESPTVRVMTYNVENLTTAELTSGSERVDSIVDVIIAIDPDILLINEIDRDASAENADRLASRIQARGGGRYATFFEPSNTGVHSGHDLDNNGAIDATPGDRAYGGDALGYGEYPGQYAMALFVREGLQIDAAAARTFQSTLWRDMPGALLPPNPDGAGAWYSNAELNVLRLSSKSHWDVPVILPGGVRLHVLASHPTPPVFDGPEDRNGRRNHDEIRFWRDYLDDASWIADDRGRSGGFGMGAFVIMGDLNADPLAGDSRDDPIGALLAHPRVASLDAPLSRIPGEDLRADATARFGLRVDHVLPSIEVVRMNAGVWRGPADSPDERASGVGLTVPGDHFPVWADLRIGSEKGRRDGLPE